MSEAGRTAWVPVEPWAGILGAGRHGRSEGAAGLLVTPRAELGLWTMIGPHGGSPALAGTVREVTGLSLPGEPRAVFRDGIGLVWSGPDRWLLVSEQRRAGHRVAGALAEVAAVSEQSDGRAVLRLSGPRLRDVLAKGCAIDLHPGVFPVGAVAITSMARIGVQLWRVDEAGTTDLLLFRSLAGSFWTWLSASAAEYGCEVAPPAL